MLCLCPVHDNMCDKDVFFRTNDNSNMSINKHSFYYRISQKIYDAIQFSVVSRKTPANLTSDAICWVGQYGRSIAVVTCIALVEGGTEVIAGAVPARGAGVRVRRTLRTEVTTRTVPSVGTTDGWRGDRGSRRTVVSSSALSRRNWKADSLTIFPTC